MPRSRPWRFWVGMLAALAALSSTGLASAQGASATRSSRHALIIGIGDYADPAVTPLRGVVHDVANARSIAQSMGVPEGNVRVLQDRGATYDNIRRELKGVAARMRDGDRLFIYFSGHGTRFLADASSSACREALVPADVSVRAKSPLLTPEEVAADLAPAYAKADKVFIFFDACHSGGVQVKARGLRDSTDVLTPKFTALETPAFCNTPSNVRRRSVRDEAESKGAPSNNVVQLSSSRPDEISLDSPATGGLATDSWRYCSIYADDTDGSGSLSVGEIAACVQKRIDNRLRNEADYTGQHLVIAGNKEYAPIQERPQKGSISAPIAVASAADPRPIPATAQRPPERPVSQPRRDDSAVPLFPLQTVIAQSDARHRVFVQQRKKALKIGRDTFEIDVTSERGGYVYLILQSSNNRDTYVLFPNALDQDNRIKANEPMQLPRSTWRMRSQGPAGVNRLLVLVTDAPRDLQALRAEPEGPFVKTLNDRSAAQSLAWVVGTAASYSDAKCTSEFARKDLVYAEQCSDSFGAQLVEFVEEI